MPGAGAYIWQQAAANTANTALGIATQRLGANWDRKQQLKTQQAMQAMQLAGEKEMIDYQTMNDLKYYGIQAQKDRLKAAGLNPALMYGMGGSMGGQSTPAAPGVSGGNAGIIDTGKPQQGMGMMNIAQLSLIDAQRKNIEADTANKQAENPNIPKVGKKIDIEVENIAQGITNMKAGKALTDAMTRIKTIEGNVAEQTQDDAEKKIHAESAKAIDEAIIAMNEAGIARETQEAKITILKQEAVGTVLRNILTREQTENVKTSTEKAKSEIQVNTAQIQKMTADIAQGWQGLSIKMKEAKVKAIMDEVQQTYQGTKTVWRIHDAASIARQIDEIMEIGKENFKNK